ncbi:MAG: hypothetical protein ABIO99_00720 [Candidatus Limnocylindria bacterium]
MDDLPRRYARLVAAWANGRADAETLTAIATEARGLAADARPAWYRVQAAGLAAAADSALGRALDLEALVGAPLPPIDAGVTARLDDLARGTGTLVGRLATHRAATAVPADVLQHVMSRMVALLLQRAEDDLKLSLGIPSLVVELSAGGEGSAWYRIDRTGETHRLVVNADRRWTAGRVLQASGSAAMRHFASLLRLPRPEWHPAPQTTVDIGMAVVGREILLGDHELEYELARIGRGAGIRWSGNQVVSVQRTIEELAPALAALALSGGSDVRAFARLGVSPGEADALRARWTDPFARADRVARAAGPPLVRQWLVTTGQTAGFGRLLREWLVPTELRSGSGDDAT